MSIVLQSTGGGSVTINEPTTASNFTLSVPATTGTLALTADIPAAYTNANALTLFNASGSAPVYACRAWVNFDGTGTSSVIAASGNVSSVTDLGTGNYVLNFTTAMPDANYSVVGCGANNAVGYFAVIAGNETLNNTTTTAAVNTCSNVGARYDGVSVFFVVFR